MERNGAQLADLFTAHAPEAVRLAFRMTADWVLAEDLVQEAFVRLTPRLAELRHPEAFPGYLRRTVVNLAYSHFRRVKVERRYLERQGLGPIEGPDPATRLEVRDALLRLPPRQRAAVALRYYEDLSVAQVAKALGCPKGTVKSMTSRGVSRLRRELVSSDPTPGAYSRAV